MDEPLSYIDEAFVDLARLAITDQVMQKGRMLTPLLCECAPGIVATSTCFFYDPKRWRLKGKKGKGFSREPIVEVQCGTHDIDDVVDVAREHLIPLKGDQWRVDLFE